ncbi:SH3 domain-containing protein [Hymenobacter sp. 5317J-9]|uniref:SH3 domain-containing protein n=1 Tax=Hymenobacter sp. 5317J-9 TaxID=2932250 RepID=UPI001FD6DDA4|nr:SH3 domain-containing protein [Hymenobacter sp. 5317J-9]UOQ96705.1 SH3 domain-containing protein [Hymenobacter sp. 5317J-9]
MTKYLLRWFLLLGSLAGCAALPDDAATAFEKGNERLAKADYAGAIRQYQQLEQRGVRRSELFCNLGDAYYKSGQLGWAVYYYEQGAQLAPANAQLAASRRVALRKAGLPAGPGASFAPGSATAVLAADACAKAAVTSLLLSGALLLLAGFGRRSAHTPRLMQGARASLWAAGGLFLLTLAGRLDVARHGIVVGAKDGGRNGPSSAARLVFALRPGEKVTIENHYQGWLKIRRASGETAWAPAPAVAVLRPQ